MSGPVGLTPGTFFALLDGAERQAISALGQPREFARGALLMYEGEPGERVMILESGRVKITRSESGGRENLLNIRDPGDVIGEVSLIDERPRVATVTALEPVHALVIAASIFRAHLERTPRVAVVLLEVETGRFREATIKRSAFAASDTVGRLAARIVELSERYGDQRDRVIAIDLALSQDELAAWTGASRAGVAKGLQLLRELGWIETRRRGLVVRSLESLRGRAA